MFSGRRRVSSVPSGKAVKASLVGAVYNKMFKRSVSGVK